MNSESMTTEQIWELLSDKLRNFLLKRVSDEQIAEDLLQEIFIRVHKGLDSLDDTQRITSWVFQITRNLVIDHYRSKAREAAVMADYLETADDEENLNEQVMGWLPHMIAQLPDTYREAVELYELKRVPQQKIADKLGISLSGAKSRVQRGREKLKSLLFACCTFEQDRRGNLIGYSRNSTDSCDNCDEGCDCYTERLKSTVTFVASATGRGREATTRRCLVS